VFIICIIELLLDVKLNVLLVLLFSCISCLCIHVDNVLLDGDYELVPTTEGEQREAEVNTVEVTEDPNPGSEEPKASTLEGKHRSITCISIIIHRLLYKYLCI
jgi:hypothetical protein